MSDSASNISLDLLGHARRNPQATALALPDREISYRELDLLVWQTARHLHEHGIRSRDVVALAFGNDLLLALALMGLARLGAVSLTLPRDATVFQRSEWVRDSACRVLVGDGPERFEPGLPSVSLTEHDIGPRRAIDPSLLDERPAASLTIVLGSGSTGAPKRIPLSHAQMRARAPMYEYAPDDRVLSLPNLGFPSSAGRMFAVLASGGCYVFPHSTDSDLAELCERKAITSISASVFHAESLLRTIPRTQEPYLKTIRTLRVSSSTVTDDLRYRIRDFLCPNLHVGFGSNESGPISKSTPPRVFTSSGTVGFPVNGARVEIVDTEGNGLPADAIGLIRVRSAGVADGYLGDPAATDASFRDGWFYTGDLGRISPDGEVIHCGRSDLMMIMDGINIAPTELEQCLVSHPSVREAVALPVRHPVHNEIPICAVTLAEGAQAAEDALLEYARARLGFRAPRRVLVVDRIPRNEAGKIARPLMLAEITKRLRG